MDIQAFINKGLGADYRGSIRFNKVNWRTFIDELLEWSYNDYEITDTAIRLALSFYKGIPIESIVADQKVGGAVLKSVYLDQLSLITGLSKDNPSLIRAIMKVPEGVGCINLFDKVCEQTKGIYKPMYRMIPHRLHTYDQLMRYGHKAIGFHKADGDVYIDLERRTVHWECMDRLYPLHKPLIEFLTKQVNRFFFSNTDAGGVIVSPGQTQKFGDGKDVVFGSFSSLGYKYSLGVNGMFVYRDWEESTDEERIKRKSISGATCPHCSAGSLYATKESWWCANSCGFEIPFSVGDRFFSESLALEYIQKLAS